MDLGQRCENLRLRVTAELAGGTDPSRRCEVLIQGLYMFSAEIVPALGTPNRSPRYLEGQRVVLALLIHLCALLVQTGDPRGVAVLVELSEGCADPLLGQKLAGYAQKLRTQGETGEGAAKPSWKIRYWVGTAVVLVWLVAMLGYGLRSRRLHLSTQGPATGGPDAAKEMVPRVTPGVPPPRISAQDVEEKCSLASAKETSAPAGSTQGAAHSTKVQVVNDQILVPVTLKNGGETVHALLLLDTGADRSALFGELAVRLRIDTSRTRASRSELADGRVIPTLVARIDLLGVGPFSHPGFEVELLPYGGPPGGHEGLLGMDFLGKHRYLFDLEQGIISWF